jgi:hypothetical protein
MHDAIDPWDRESWPTDNGSPRGTDNKDLLGSDEEGDMDTEISPEEVTELLGAKSPKETKVTPTEPEPIVYLHPDKCDIIDLTSDPEDEPQTSKRDWRQSKPLSTSESTVPWSDVTTRKIVMGRRQTGDDNSGSKYGPKKNANWAMADRARSSSPPTTRAKSAERVRSPSVNDQGRKKIASHTSPKPPGNRVLQREKKLGPKMFRR